jgi:hypothetical protein
MSAAPMRGVLGDRRDAERDRGVGDSLTDPGPRVLVAAFRGVVRSAAPLWSTGEELTVESLRQPSEHHLEPPIPAPTTVAGIRPYD